MNRSPLYAAIAMEIFDPLLACSSLEKVSSRPAGSTFEAPYRLDWLPSMEQNLKQLLDPGC